MTTTTVTVTSSHVQQRNIAPPPSPSRQHSDMPGDQEGDETEPSVLPAECKEAQARPLLLQPGL